MCLQLQKLGKAFGISFDVNGVRVRRAQMTFRLFGNGESPLLTRGSRTNDNLAMVVLSTSQPFLHRQAALKHRATLLRTIIDPQVQEKKRMKRLSSLQIFTIHTYTLQLYYIAQRSRKRECERFVCIFYVRPWHYVMLHVKRQHRLFIHSQHAISSQWLESGSWEDLESYAIGDDTVHYRFCICTSIYRQDFLREHTTERYVTSTFHGSSLDEILPGILRSIPNRK